MSSDKTVKLDKKSTLQRVSSTLCKCFGLKTLRMSPRQYWESFEPDIEEFINIFLLTELLYWFTFL